MADIRWPQDCEEFGLHPIRWDVQGEHGWLPYSHVHCQYLEHIWQAWHEHQRTGNPMDTSTLRELEHDHAIALTVRDHGPEVRLVLENTYYLVNVSALLQMGPNGHNRRIRRVASTKLLDIFTVAIVASDADGRIALQNLPEHALLAELTGWTVAKEPVSCPVCFSDGNSDDEDGSEESAIVQLRCGHAICISMGHAVGPTQMTQMERTRFTDCCKQWFQRSMSCPMCNAVYAEHRGSQPDGTMTVVLLPEVTIGLHCAYPEAIQMQVAFPAGVTSDGYMFGNSSFTAYLPDTAQGRALCLQCVRAFQRKLLFKMELCSDNRTIRLLPLLAWITARESLQDASTTLDVLKEGLDNLLKPSQLCRPLPAGSSTCDAAAGVSALPDSVSAAVPVVAPSEDDDQSVASGGTGTCTGAAALPLALRTQPQVPPARPNRSKCKSMGRSIYNLRRRRRRCTFGVVYCS